MDGLTHASAILRPPAVYAVGLNYSAHAEELNITSASAPTVFALWPNSLSGHEGTTSWPRSLSEEVDYEVELGVIIGKAARDVSEADALDHVFGYTVVNDITARNLQFSEQQWSRCKSFDGFSPTGPVVVTRDEVPDPQDLRITTVLDGETVQDGRTSGMVRTVARLVGAQIAHFGVGEGIAHGAVVDRVHRLVQRARQHGRAFAVMLQQVKGHALRRLRTNAGQAPQRLGQEVERPGHEVLSFS